MTINHARAILNFIIDLKKQGKANEEIIWLLANEFNLEPEPELGNNAEPIKNYPEDDPREDR